MAKRAKRPNILLVSCDQWRGDCLSVVGHPVVRTPNADALAAEGTLFSRHYAGAAPCSPARACLYTGLYQMNNRVCRNGTPLDDRHDNIARTARRPGYDPTLFGYTDTSPDPRLLSAEDPSLRTYEGALPGFTVRTLLPEHQKPWLSWLKQRGVETDRAYPEIHRPADGSQASMTRSPPVYSKDETPTAFLAGELIRWLGEQEGGNPWFAHISFISPHPPFIVPEPYNTMYDPADGPAFRRGPSAKAEAKAHRLLQHDYSGGDVSKFVPGEKGKVADLSDERLRTIRALYYGMISEVDAQVGRIRAALDELGFSDETVIVLTSDHAEMMGDHFRFGKGGFYDQSYHIPLIVRDPRQRKSARGRTVQQFTEAVDLMPTLATLMGGEPAPWLDGRSLTPFLAGEEPEHWRTEAHWEFDFRSISKGKEERLLGLTPQQCNLSVLRSAEFKYVHFGGGLPPLLFDLHKDPDELVDRASDPDYAATRIMMAEKLLAWRAEHLDQRLALTELTDEGVVTYRE